MHICNNHRPSLATSAMFISLLTILNRQVFGCSMTEEYRLKPFLERAAQADVIAYGRVIDKIPIDPTWTDSAYHAEIEFYCILREYITYDCAEVDPNQFGICVEKCYKNDECPEKQLCCSNGCGHVCAQPVPVKGGKINKIANVTEMGYFTSCSTTEVENNTDYIFLLQWRDSEGVLVPHDINMQTAALPDTDETWRDLSVLCNISTIAPVGRQSCPSSISETKLHTIADGRCYAGAKAIRPNDFTVLFTLGCLVLYNLYIY
ncbi:uncharacterized protein LOC144438940 [Glandiceps talaboti]